MHQPPFLPTLFSALSPQIRLSNAHHREYGGTPPPSKGMGTHALYLFSFTLTHVSFRTPQFLAVIPGGQSFSVPETPFTVVSQQGTGFSWTPSVRGGTTLMLVGGDDRGAGSAGSVLNTVSFGVSTNNTCLDNNSPSSTPGSPAGGSYATSTDGSGWTSSNSGGSYVYHLQFQQPLICASP